MTTPNISMTWLALLLAGAPVGCVGRGDGENGNTENLLESCQGYYWCDELDVELYLTSSGAACDVGDAVLNPDGSVTFHDDPEADGWWSGNTSAFELCYEGVCTQCTSEDYEEDNADDADDDEDCPYECHPETDCSWGYDGDYECEMHEECDYAC